MRRDSPSPYWDALLTSLIRLPSLMMGAASIYQLGVRAICLKLSYSSHRPNGIFTCFALVLAGRRCLRRKWHGDHLIVHHQWQLSWTGTCKPCLQIPRMQTSQCPDGKGADALALTLACTTATDASVNYRMYVPDAETLKMSDPPDGRLTFVLICSSFAGRRCLCRFWHGHDNVFLDLREYSYICACS